MKILIIGCNGQVGQELLLLLAQTSCYDVICTDRSILDISIEYQVKDMIFFHRPDIVINASGYTAVDRAEEDTVNAYSVNEKGPEFLAKYCSEVGAIIFHISTDYVFSGEKVLPYVESDLAKPLSIYGLSKYAGELAVARNCKRHIILRTSWVFGVFGNNFVKTMLLLGQENNKISVVTDQYGGPTSSSGIAKVLLDIAGFYREGKDINWGIYHYSGYPYTSWSGFASTIFTIAKKVGVISSDVEVVAARAKDFEKSAVRPMNSRLNCTKIYKEFGIEPDNWTEKLSLML